MGAFIYMADIVARQCHAGEDPDFAAWLADSTARFDAYITRNNPEGAAGLASFKEDEGLAVQYRPEICSSEYSAIYGNFLGTDRTELDGYINDLLANDGPPSYGDCV